MRRDMGSATELDFRDRPKQVLLSIRSYPFREENLAEACLVLDLADFV
jgi:hypothetical protein